MGKSEQRDRFVPQEKLGKKAKKELAAARRAVWAFSPVSRKVESKKTYNRKRTSRIRYDDGTGGSCFA